MKFCCRGLEACYEEASTQGVSLEVSPFSESFAFWLYFRAVDEGAESAFEGVVTPVPVALKTRRRITYCPWCGKNLAHFYARSWKDLIRDGPIDLEPVDGNPDEQTRPDLMDSRT